MKVLCVAEKPSIAKSITGILSGGQYDVRNSSNKYIKNYDFSYRLHPPLGRTGDADFTVTSVLGHLMGMDFPEDYRKWHSCDPFDLFDAPIDVKVSSDLRNVEQNLQREARNADLLMIWTDCDREGEGIGAEVANVCRSVNRRIVVKRARFSAIIAAQIHAACQNANDLDVAQADAVEARQVLDLRAGAAVTRFTTMSLQSRVAGLDQQLISYGPCQFPTLGFVVEQFNKVQSFVPETFWYIHIAIERESTPDPEEEEASGRRNAQANKVEFKWKRNHLFEQAAVYALHQQCCDEPMATVTNVETKPTTKYKPLPLTTVELQQSGSRLLHMTPKRILDIAEKLYQRGILSYPRTETDQYDKAFDFNSLIQKQTHDTAWGPFAQRLINGEFQTPRNGRKNDKAHPPIHPTSHAANLEGDERRVFELVARRFLASCHRNAEGKTTTVEVNVAGEEFSTSGLVVLQRNYLDVYPYDKWASTSVPDFDQGEQFLPSVCELKSGQTSRPNLLTEADLVGLMDKNGIGTDATIAEHIAKIIEREYVIEKQEQKVKYLVPSLLGVALVEGFDQIGLDRSLTKPHLRAECICDRQYTKTEVLEHAIEEYKQVYMLAKNNFQIVVDTIEKYLHGQGEIQDAVRSYGRGRGRPRGSTSTRGTRGTGGTRGARGGRGGAADSRRNDEADDSGGDDDDGGPSRGGGGARARGNTRGSKGTTRGASRSAATANRNGIARSAGASHTTQDNETPTCSCGSQAALRTVSKASQHQGRQFYTCPKPQGEQCGFFEWANPDVMPQARAAPAPRAPTRPRIVVDNDVEDESDEPPSKRSRPAAASNIFGDDDDGSKRCNCGLEAKMGIATKDGPNKGRSFWKCPNNPKASCGFFEWDGQMGSGAGPSSSRAAGSGGSSGECFKCGQGGHWASNCPDEATTGRGLGVATARGAGAVGRERSGECFKCGQSGHWSSECPNEDSHARGNGGNSSAARGTGGGGTTGECFKCGQTGHWASDCPNGEGEGGSSRVGGTRSRGGGRGKKGGRGGTARSSSKKGGAGASNECYKCGGTGHWASDCPN